MLLLMAGAIFLVVGLMDTERSAWRFAAAALLALAGLVRMVRARQL